MHTIDDRDWYEEENLRQETIGHRSLPSERSKRFAQLAARTSHPSWASDQNSFDYRHLSVPFSSATFLLTSSHLSSLFLANRFPVTQGQDEVLFGLRGCKPAGLTNNDFSDTVQLVESVPDHVDFHCVLGVWKRSTGQLAVFSGSTVPNGRYMQMQVVQGGQKCNMLPTGRYIYTVGNHRAVIGAFIQQANVIVRRSNEDLIYENTDFHERHSPADNIHPAFSDPEAEFSSAGCVTIPGSWNGTHIGEWGVFRNRAGLSSSNDSRFGERYIFILLTGRDARLVSQGTDPAQLARLRFGSSGREVATLQHSLQSTGFDPGAHDGEMGMDTVNALILRQKTTQNGVADGIQNLF